MYLNGSTGKKNLKSLSLFAHFKMLAIIRNSLLDSIECHFLRLAYGFTFIWQSIDIFVLMQIKSYTTRKSVCRLLVSYKFLAEVEIIK